MQESLSEESRIYFCTESHRERFQAAINNFGERAVWGGERIDVYYGSALYLLTMDDTIWEKAQAYFTSVGIDFKKMLKGIHLSTTETALVALAGALFGQAIKSSPTDLIDLDERNFSVAVQALQLRRKAHNLSQI